MAETIDEAASGGANAVLMHKEWLEAVIGIRKRYWSYNTSFSQHIPGPDPDHKVLVTTVEKAIKLGADAVSVHVNVGSKKNRKCWQTGNTTEICDDWACPHSHDVPRGAKIADEHDADVVKLAARAGAELEQT